MPIFWPLEHESSRQTRVERFSVRTTPCSAATPGLPCKMCPSSGRWSSRVFNMSPTGRAANKSSSDVEAKPCKLQGSGRKRLLGPSPGRPRPGGAHGDLLRAAEDREFSVDRAQGSDEDADAFLSARIERGEVKHPRRATLAAIAERLGTTSEELAQF